MKWKIWQRQHKPQPRQQIQIKGFGDDRFAAIPIRMLFDDAPIKIDHTIIHTPYPHPDTITITLYDKDGRQFVMPPINCRGGVYYPLQIPDWGPDNTWIKMDVKVYYVLSSR